jgi:hypothetical protein
MHGCCDKSPPEKVRDDLAERCCHRRRYDGDVTPRFHARCIPPSRVADDGTLSLVRRRVTSFVQRKKLTICCDVQTNAPMGVAWGPFCLSDRVKGYFLKITRGLKILRVLIAIISPNGPWQGKNHLIAVGTINVRNYRRHSTQ